MPLPSQAPEITPRELIQAVEGGQDVQVLDVRAPARLATGRIEIVPSHRFHNVAGSTLITLNTPEQIGLPTELPVAVVCARGNDSRVIAQHLTQLGYRARSLRGGMQEWMGVLLPRDLPAPTPLDRLIQFDRLGKGALGYLLVSGNEALIVDPPRDTAPYLTAAKQSGATVVAVADTHVHADYISGAPALARSLGVPYYLHSADAVYPYDGTLGTLSFTGVTDGSTIRFGRCTVSVAHTPGHTEGSVTYLVGDVLALTGDFLFIASVGRPDLAGKVNEWSAALWRSMERAKREWPATMVIYPAHYAVERERQGDHSIGRPFGDVLKTNEPLQIQTAADFATWVQERTSGFPEVYRRIKAINVGLETVDDHEAEVLELGKNECALG